MDGKGTEKYARARAGSHHGGFIRHARGRRGPFGLPVVASGSRSSGAQAVPPNHVYFALVAS